MADYENKIQSGAPSKVTRVVTDYADIELLPRQPYEVSFINMVPSIGFAFDSQSGEHALGSDRIRTYRARANTMAFVPTRCDVYSSSETGGEYLKIIPKNAQSTIEYNETPTSNLMVPKLIPAAYLLKRQLLAGDTIDMLDLEKNVYRFITLFCASDLKGYTDLTTAQWMSAERIGAVEEYIEENLYERLTVTQIAQKFELSTGFFSRDFKKAFGKPPHDYIIDRRISKATELLVSGQTGITDIAISTGFSSHAHMSMVFKQRLGVSPRFIRRNS